MVGDLPLRAARCPDQSKKTNFVRFFFQTLLRYNIPIEVPLQIKRQTCLSQTLPTPFGSPGDATENRGGEAGHLMNGNTDLGGSRYWKSIGPRHSMGLEYTSTRRRNDRLRHGGLVVRGLALFEVSTGNLLEGAGIHTLTLHGTASGTAIFTYIGGGARGVNGAAVLWQSHGSCLGYIDPPPQKKDTLQLIGHQSQTGRVWVCSRLGLKGRPVARLGTWGSLAPWRQRWGSNRGEGRIHR